LIHTLALSPVLHSFSTVTATPHIYPLSLHDALPISASAWQCRTARSQSPATDRARCRARPSSPACARSADTDPRPPWRGCRRWRSEEHTSELQSHLNLVCRLLLEKKKKNIKT